MRCAICGRDVPTQPYSLASGQVIGHTCGDACGALLWQSHFDRVADAPKHERAVTGWQIRRRAALANGQSFTEPAPRSPTELELSREIERAGLGDVARELE